MGGKRGAVSMGFPTRFHHPICLIPSPMPHFYRKCVEKFARRRASFGGGWLCYISNTIPQFTSHLGKTASLGHLEIHSLYSKGLCLK